MNSTDGAEPLESMSAKGKKRLGKLETLDLQETQNTLAGALESQYNQDLDPLGLTKLKRVKINQNRGGFRNV